MNESAAPDEQPPYMERAREMTFGRLRKFTEDALEKLSDPGADAELPRSKAEFDTLIEMLTAHVDALRADAPEPVGPRPTDRLPYVSIWFEPSEKLDAAYERRDDLRERLNEARFDPSRRREAERLESELNPLEREIAEREAAEKQEHARRRDEYERAGGDYYRAVRRWEKRGTSQREWDEKVAFRARIVERVRKDIERAFKSGAGVSTETIRWDLLPQGKSSVETVVRGLYSGMRGRGEEARFDQERLDKALELDPNRCYVGRDGFDGYVVFTFADTPTALMECPRVGNAIYVIHSDWERWSKMTKQELMEEAERGGDVTRIPHQGDWYAKVRRELGIA